MPKVGDRVIVEGNKVGQQRREGTLMETLGSLIKVRWTDGTESLFTPGAGSVRFETGNGTSARRAAAGTKPAKAAKPAAKKAGSAKSEAAKKASKPPAKAVAKGKPAKAGKKK